MYIMKYSIKYTFKVIYFKVLQSICMKNILVPINKVNFVSFSIHEKHNMFQFSIKARMKEKRAETSNIYI